MTRLLRQGSPALGIVIGAVTRACGLMVGETVFPSNATFRLLAAEGMHIQSGGRTSAVAETTSPHALGRLSPEFAVTAMRQGMRVMSLDG